MVIGLAGIKCQRDDTEAHVFGCFIASNFATLTATLPIVVDAMIRQGQVDAERYRGLLDVLNKGASSPDRMAKNIAAAFESLPVRATTPARTIPESGKRKLNAGWSPV